MTKAWVAGGSGLVGGDLLEQLLADAHYSEILSVGRRSLPIVNGKLVQATVDFSDPKSFEPLDPAEVAFSCLGTTIKKAGSPEKFRAVDLDAVVTFAKAARAHGATVFVHVTSLSANPKSGQLYIRTKGEVEEAVGALGFESVYALRPSFLDGGTRERPESRPLERFSIGIARALKPILGKYGPTTTIATARTMIAKAKEAAPGNHVVDAGEIT